MKDAGNYVDRIIETPLLKKSMRNISNQNKLAPPKLKRNDFSHIFQSV
jgi:hypothetical protein